MKYRGLHKFLTAFALLSGASLTLATNLIQVYDQALSSDPTFKIVVTQAENDKMNLQIARSGLFPDFTITGAGSRLHKDSYGGVPRSADGTLDNVQYQLTLSQPIFNFATWRSISEASSVVKAAEASYSAGVQDLIDRTAEAYFGVLQASAQLKYTLAQKRALYRQLQTQEQKYKVGLVAVTDVYQAQAKYDETVAQEIADRNSLNDSMEALRAITGSYYTKLSSPASRVPLVTPSPSNIDDWVQVSEKQNYTLLNTMYLAEAAKQNIKVQSAARLPTVTASGDWGQNYNYPKSGRITAAPRNTINQYDVNAQVNIPLFQGGLVFATTKQAGYNYQNVAAIMDLTHRSTVQGVRTNYLGVISGISKIKADKQAIVSAQSALKATEAGYIVGTQTFSDVLDQIVSVTKAQQSYSDDQYAYLIETIKLKEFAGTLGLNDIRQINGWLTSSTNIAQQLKPSKMAVQNVKKVSKIPPYSMHKSHLNKDLTIAKPVGGGPNGSGKAPSKSPVRSPNKSTGTSPRLPQVKPSASYNTSAEKITRVYTLQLFASRAKSAALNFYNRQKFHPDQLHVYLTHTATGDLYKVTYGRYSNYSDAKNAMNSLPTVYSKFKPWVIAVPVMKKITAATNHSNSTTANSTAASSTTTSTLSKSSNTDSTAAPSANSSTAPTTDANPTATTPSTSSSSSAAPTTDANPPTATSTTDSSATNTNATTKTQSSPVTNSNSTTTDSNIAANTSSTTPELVLPTTTSSTK